MSRIVNLDDKKNTVSITVGGETFDIARVVLAVHKMYGEYVQQSARFLDKVKAGQVTENSGELDEYVEQKVAYIDKLMDKILSKNGYTYDAEWWAENVEGYQDMESFIVECLRKDTEDSKKKEAVLDNLMSTE